MGCQSQAIWGPRVGPYVAPSALKPGLAGAYLGPACLAGGSQLAKYGGNGLNRNKHTKKHVKNVKKMLLVKTR